MSPAAAAFPEAPSEEAPHQARPGAPGEPFHRLRAVVTGVAAAASAFTVLVSGAVPETVAALVVVVLLGLVPTAPTLSRRVALNVALLAGWAPLLWWVKWPVPVNHGAMVAAVAVGGLAAAVAGSPRPVGRLRTLLPAVRGSDVLLPVSGAVALLAAQTLAFASTPLRALAVLLPGADNHAHFNMFAGLRAYGATSDAVGKGPDGSGWAFDNYPKAFHGLVATISEVTFPKMATGPESLVVYAHSVALVIALGTIMVTAAVLSMPRLGNRPAVALPVLAVTWAGLLWEPGQKVLANGFASFWLAAVAAASALLLGTSAPRSLRSAEVAAVGGLLVATAHAWTPLVLIAVPAAAAVLVWGPASGGQRLRSRQRLVGLGILALGALAALRAVVILMQTVPVGFIVSEVSGFDGTSPLPTFTMTIVVLYVLVSYRSWLRARTGEDLDRVMRVRLLALLSAVVLGLASLTALLLMQLNAIGTTSYYFLKYLLGYELILACVTPAVTGMLIAGVTSPARNRRLAAVLSLVTALLASQFFGHLSVRDALLFSETDDGTASITPPYTRLGIARGILAATAATTPAESFGIEYLPLGAGNAAQLFYPDAWYHAINASYTYDVGARMTVLRVNAEDVDAATPLVREVLAGGPDIRVMTSQPYADVIRGRLAAPELAARILPIARATR